MSINDIKFIITTIILMLGCLALTNNYLLSSLISIILSTGIYIYTYWRSARKRLNILENLCDPETFIDSIEEYRKKIGKNTKNNICLDIDKSAGLISLGEFQKARELLESIDKSKLSTGDGTIFAYTVNLISCLYNLKEIVEAEKLYETELPGLAPVYKKSNLGLKMLIGSRFYFLNRYEEGKEHLEMLLNKNLTKREKLTLLYRLGEIDKKLGNLESANEKFKEVAEMGNKLWISKQAKIYLNGRS